MVISSDTESQVSKGARPGAPAFLRRFAAGGSGSGAHQRSSFRGQIGRRVGPLSQQRGVTILLEPFSSWGQAIWHQASRYFSQREVPRPWG